MSARAQVLANTSTDALHEWAAHLASPGFAALPLPRQASALYGAVLAAAKLRDFARLPALLRQLAALTEQDAPAARQVRLLGAEVAVAAGELRPAKALLTGPATEQQRPELLLVTQALIRSGPTQAGLAAQQLQSWLSKSERNGRDAQAWQQLSAAYAVQGQTLRAIRAEAEVQVAHLDFAAANDRFKAAQELVREQAKRGVLDHIEASIIDTRARQNSALLREQAGER
jgi:predicted nucleotidyltransferase